MEIWLDVRSYHFSLTIQSTLLLKLIQSHLLMCFLALNWDVYKQYVIVVKCKRKTFHIHFELIL